MGATTAGRWRDRPAAVWVVGLALALATFAIYFQGLAAPFVLDDELSVTYNRSIVQLADLRAVLSPPGTSPVGGRPLANLTFAFNHAVGGLQPAGYRLFNVALHLGSALLLLGVVRRTVSRCAAPWAAAEALPLAFVVAAVWALHPLQAGTVLYVAQRTELLMGFFYLLTLYAFIRSTESDSRVWRVVSVVACACGMASKEVMVTAPFVVLLYDRVFVAGTIRAAWRQRGGTHLALAATWLLLAALMAGLGQRSVGFDLGVQWWRYGLTEFQAVTTYVRLALWPDPLVFDYGPVFLFSAGDILPHAVGVLALLVGAAVAWLRRPRAGLVAAAYFIILAPTSTVVPIVLQPIAESRSYLPLAAVCILVALGVRVIAGRRAYLGLGLGLPVLAWLTHARIEVVRDPLALWSDTVAKRPGNARARSNLGAFLLERGRAAEAVVQVREALRYDPNVATVRSNLGAALFAVGQVDEAILHEREAVRLDPSLAIAHANLAAALIKRGRYEEALGHARRAADLQPAMTFSHFQAGTALLYLGRPAEAVAPLLVETKLAPGNAEARSNLGAAYFLLGRHAEAIGEYREVLRQRPDNIDARSNLAGALVQAGKLDEAAGEFAAILQRQPDHPRAKEGLAFIGRMKREPAGGQR